VVSWFCQTTDHKIFHTEKSSMRFIRSSEVGTYLYCARAWDYHRQGVESAYQAEMNLGIELHRRHGWGVLTASLTRLLAWIILLAALFLLSVFIVNQGT
jgi:hypothetical protein